MNKLGIYKWGVILSIIVLAACSSPQARRAKFLARGKQFATKGEYSRAILEFRHAAKAMPKDGEAYYLMGMAYTQPGTTDRFWRLFEKRSS